MIVNGRDGDAIDDVCRQVTGLGMRAVGVRADGDGAPSSGSVRTGTANRRRVGPDADGDGPRRQDAGGVAAGRRAW